MMPAPGTIPASALRVEPTGRSLASGALAHGVAAEGVGMVTLDNRLIVVVAMMAALVFGLAQPGTGRAQDAAPAADAVAAGIPNHIHTGTCDDLGHSVAPL